MKINSINAFIEHIIILTGAGISAESGLHTFRDQDGLWRGHSVYEVATPEAWHQNPQLVLDFYNMRRRAVLSAEPNTAHILLAQLEAHYKVTIITQNVDDLHERAGSTQVIHLHGEILKAQSENNPELIVDMAGDLQLGDQGSDRAQLRPHVVWFGESILRWPEATQAARSADRFVIIGTSLQVYPAASLLNYVPDSSPVYIIDRDIPHLDSARNVHVIQSPATIGVKQLMEELADQ